VLLLKEKNLKIIFAWTLLFSVVLEIYVRVINELIFGIDGFGMIPYIDNVMHFFWGLNFFFAAIIFFKLEVFDALIVVFLWQMIWESVEMIGDVVLAQPVHMLDHFFFDGIKDTIVDIAGALLGWLMIRLLEMKGVKKYPVFRRFGIVYSFAIVGLAIIGSLYYIYCVKFFPGVPFKSPDIFATTYILVSAFFSFLIAKMVHPKA
jgi:hypothetical protein